MNAESTKLLFLKLFRCATEQGVEKTIENCVGIRSCGTWHTLDDNESNFGVIENQQSSPIAALIEKITNSIDAILMRKCYEARIDPKSAAAPNSMEEAVARFFHPQSESWYLGPPRQAQAEEIQILADGPRMNTSLVIYDSHTLKSHKGRIRGITEEQIKLADKKYISSIYFHTLFLFAIAKQHNYTIKQGEKECDLRDFLHDTFSSFYSEFLLNFGTEQLMASLEL